MSACTQKTPNLLCWFLTRRLTNTPRPHRLADGQLSSLYPPSPSFSSFGAASVILCCSAPPVSSSTPLRTSVHYPSISLLLNIMCSQTFFNHKIVLYTFDQTWLYLFWSQPGSLCRGNSRLIVSRPSLSLYRPLTTLPNWWPALTDLPPLPKFQLVWRRLCKSSAVFLVPRWSETFVSVVSSSLQWRRSFFPEYED